MATNSSEEATMQALFAGLGFLRDHGFTPGESSASVSEASGRIWRVGYASAAHRRKISVTYYPDRRRAQACILHTDDDFAFADAGAKYFRKPRWEDVPGEGLDKLTTYLTALRIELVEAHSDLLGGAPFSNDTFDWSPYK